MSNVKYGKRDLYNPAGRIFFIGDVHNEATKLKSLLSKLVPQVTPKDHIVFLGDLVNRGDEPAETIEALVNLTRQFPTQTFFCEGNHCWMLRHFLATGSSDWMAYLYKTLDGLASSWNLPDTHPDTIAKALLDHGFGEITSRMIPYYETPEVIATHAPFDNDEVLSVGGAIYAADYLNYHQDPTFTYLIERLQNSIKWQFTLESLPVRTIDKFCVYGHQPSNLNTPRLYDDRAFVDTGCGKGNRPLTCFVYPYKTWFQS